jgi:hypothetical protein
LPNGEKSFEVTFRETTERGIRVDGRYVRGMEKVWIDAIPNVKNPPFWIIEIDPGRFHVQLHEPSGSSSTSSSTPDSSGSTQVGTEMGRLRAAQEGHPVEIDGERFEFVSRAEEGDGGTGANWRNCVWVIGPAGVNVDFVHSVPVTRHGYQGMRSFLVDVRGKHVVHPVGTGTA